MLCAQAIAGPNGFNLTEDFPNYFKQTKHSDAEMRLALTKAMSSIVDRLGVYHFKDGKIEKSNFFKYLVDQIKKKDPGAKVYLSGDVVPSLLGYVYQKLDRMRKEHPEKDCFDLLEEIANENLNRKRDKILESIRVLGVGSELEVLFTPSPEHQSDSEEMRRMANQLINSARKQIMKDRRQDPILDSILFHGDVNLYEKQTAKVVKNGGSSLDDLVFDLSSRQLQEPNPSLDTISKFMNGKLDCIPGTESEKSAGTTIHILQTLVEIPFLQLTENCRRQLKGDLVQLIAQVESSSSSLNQDILIQFEKMARNARFGGGHNRFYESQDEIDLLVKELMEEVGKTVYVIPPFVQQSDPKTRKIKPLPPEVLMDYKKFKELFTQDGITFHGTLQFSNFLNMLRNGPVRSNKNPLGSAYNTRQASEGTGAYTTQYYHYAFSYSKKEGIVVPMQIRDNPPPRVLNWNEVKDQDSIQKIVAEAKERGQDPFEVLAKEYGIDLIVNTNIVLVQNASIVSLPKNLNDMIHTQFQSLVKEVTNTPANLKNQGWGGTEKLIKQIERYEKLYLLGKSLGYQNLLPVEEAFVRVLQNRGIEVAEPPSTKDQDIPEKLQQMIRSGLQAQDPSTRLIAAISLIKLKVSNPKELFEMALHDPDFNVVMCGARSLSNYHDSKTLFEFLSYALIHPERDVRFNAMQSLLNYRGERAEELFTKAILAHPHDAEVGEILAEYFRPQNISIIEKYLRSGNPIFTHIAVQAIIHLRGEEYARLSEEALQHPDLNVRRIVSIFLRYFSNGKEAYPCFMLGLRDAHPDITTNTVFSFTEFPLNTD